MASRFVEPALDGPSASGGSLSVFTHALSAKVLRAHADGALGQRELEGAIGWAPESTLRGALDRLADLGALTVHRPPRRTGRATFSLTPPGRDLLAVAAALERWLRDAPPGPASLEEDFARATLRMLLGAWEGGVVRALAERPSSPAELGAGGSRDNGSTVRGRLPKLRAAGLAERVAAGRNATYAATDWLRRAVVPLAVAIGWELRNRSDLAPPRALEAETMLLLALPLVELSPRASGSCTLAVLVPDERTGKARPARVDLRIERGRVVTIDPAADDDPATWILGTGPAWLDATIAGRTRALRVGGAAPRLAQHLVKRIRESLRCD